MAKTTTSQPAMRGILAIIALILGVGAAFGLSYQVFGGSLETMQSTDGYQNILLVNALVGVCVFLFIVELKWDALRVVLTVVFALLLGYLVTFTFSLDTANRFLQGEGKVRIVSEAEPIEDDNADMEYNQQRAVNFSATTTDARFTFAGRAGDVVSIVGFAGSRRENIDLQVALSAPDGATLAEATDIPAERMEAYEDVRKETDALIENFSLPADGIYTVQMQPQPLSNEVVMREAFQQTNLAYQAFLLGPIGRPNRWAVWIQDALTLVLVGLAIAIVFRARQFSLGAEGQLYFGALASGVLMLQFGEVLPAYILIPLGISAAMLAGFLWGLVPGALKAYLGANELVSTLMLNAVAIRFYELILIFQLKPSDAGYIASANYPTAGTLPPILAGTQVTIAVYVVLVVVLLAWLLMRRTPLGYEIRIIGSNIRFADYGGIKTRRNIMLAMAISGAVAGLAGMHLGMGIHRRLILNISLGLAFEGVVVALLARNNVLVVPFTALLYAYLRAGAQFMERDANVSFEVVRIIQAVIILLITAEALIQFFRNRRQRRQTLAQSTDATPSSPDALPDASA